MKSDFSRYSCQLQLPEFNRKKQELLKKAKVLIVGMGGLGCPASQYLVSAGIGTLGIIDHDEISINNLSRQFLYTPKDLGLKKVKVAAKRLQQQNPDTKIIPYPLKVTSSNIFKIIKNYDIIVDGTDNFETKYLLNDACVIAKKPLVYGAIFQYEGQVAVFNIKNKDGTRSPNYRDIFPNAMNSSTPNCAEGGVIPTLAGIIGCMQASEVLKYLIKSNDILSGKLWIIDTKSTDVNIINIGKKTHVKISHLPKSNVMLISPEELREGIKNNLYEIIDVRRVEEHKKFNLGGKNIPLDTLLNDPNNYKFTKPVVFYCLSGRRSAEAAKIFKKLQPSLEFFSLEGGVNTWKSLINTS